MAIFRYRFAVLVVLTRCCAVQNKRYVWVEGSFLSSVPPPISATVIFRYRFAILVVLTRCCAVQNKRYVWVEGSFFCHFPVQRPSSSLCHGYICHRFVPLMGAATSIIFIATKHSSQQKLCLSRQNFCHDKHVFVATSILFS